MTTEPLREVRDHLSDYVDRAASQHERVIVTRNGRPVAVLIGYEDLEALEETLDILSDPNAIADLAAADKAIEAGKVVHGVDAVRNLRTRDDKAR